MFEKGSHVPSAKMLTFYRSEPFTVTAAYTDDSDIPPTASRHIGGLGYVCGMMDVCGVGWGRGAFPLIDFCLVP